MMEKAKQRDSSFELLRLMLMFLIVFHHAITHGLGLDSFASWSMSSLLIPDDEMYLYLSLNNLGIFAVNAFVIISGYFGIKSTWKKANTLVLCVLFYTILFSTIPHIIYGDYYSAIKSLFVISHTPYWFITDYLILMLFAPVFNKAFDVLDESTMKTFTAGVLLIAVYLGFFWGNDIDRSGYNFYHFIVLYAIGRSIAKGWIDRLLPMNSILLFSGTMIANMILACLFYKIGQGDLVWKTTYYSNPLLIISAFAMVMMFKHLHFRNKAINYLASSALGIYLFQNADYISEVFYGKVARCACGGGYKSLIITIVTSFVMCVTAIVVDKIRIAFFNVLLKGIHLKKEIKIWPK